MRSSELIVDAALRGLGCDVLKDGWPDFLVVTPAGEVMAIEVKSLNDVIAKHQLQNHELLKRAGIRVEIIHVDVPNNKIILSRGPSDRELNEVLNRGYTNAVL